MHQGLAHRPPRSASKLESAASVVSELLLLGVAGAAGLLLLSVLLGTGVLPDPTTHVWSSVIGGPILMGGAILAYWGIDKLMARGERETGPLVPESARASWPTTSAIVLLHVGAAVAGSVVLGTVQELVFDQPIAEQEAIVELVATGDPMLLGLLAVVAVGLAPLTEEALFRGMFFRRLRIRASVAAAWILPALVFALAHWNPIGLAIYVWLGLVFAHAYARTGRLTAAILTHAGANAITFALLVYAPPPEVEEAAARQTVAATEEAEAPP
jgi:membrane protease YdiL (CAAX protease family)